MPNLAALKFVITPFEVDIKATPKLPNTTGNSLTLAYTRRPGLLILLKS